MCCCLWQYTYRYIIDRLRWSNFSCNLCKDPISIQNRLRCEAYVVQVSTQSWLFNWIFARLASSLFVNIFEDPIVAKTFFAINGNPLRRKLNRWQVPLHDAVIEWKHFPRYWLFVRGIHWSPVNSTHKGHWRGPLMFSLTCVWIIDWVNNREAGEMKRHRAHYGVIVIKVNILEWFAGNLLLHLLY